MMQEDYVTYEQAKLLKEKGFPQDIDEDFPNTTLIVFSDEPNNIIDYFSASIQGFLDDDYLTEHSIKWYVAPTLSLVQKWLRKEKEFDVFVTVSKTKTEFPYSWHIIVNRGYDEPGEELPHIYSTEPVSTPEQALSAGIDKALTLI